MYIIPLLDYGILKHFINEKSKVKTVLNAYFYWFLKYYIIVLHGQLKHRVDKCINWIYKLWQSKLSKSYLYTSIQQLYDCMR